MSVESEFHRIEVVVVYCHEVGLFRDRDGAVLEERF